MPHHGLVVVATLALVIGAWAGARGVRLLARGLRGGEDPSAPLWVVRGLRGLIVAICMAVFAVGTVLGQAWLVLFSALWLAEEICETGVLALILRADAERLPRSLGSAGPGGRIKRPP